LAAPDAKSDEHPSIPALRKSFANHPKSVLRMQQQFEGMIR